MDPVVNLRLFNSVSSLITRILAESAKVYPPEATEVAAGIIKVVNNLTSTDKLSALSAAQGKVLKDLLDSISAILVSNDASLNTLQKVVTYIKQNRNSINLLNNAVGLIELELPNKVNVNDSRLTDAREWVASTVSQAEAEAGTATTRRAFTAQRVRQSIAAYTQPFTAADRAKLDTVADGAQVNVATNLSYTADTNSGSVNSSTGANATIPGATVSHAGLLSNVDKAKLDTVADGAQVNVPTNLGFTLTQTSATITSSTGSNAVLPTATASLAGVMTSADRIKLDAVAPGAQVNVATNLSYNSATTNGVVVSSTGTNATIPAVTGSSAGLMTTTDKNKLDGIAAGAQVNVPTNLSYTAAASTGTVVSSTGTNATLPAATTAAAGLMSNDDKSKLNGIAAGAQVNVATNLGYVAAATTGTITSSTGNNVTIPAVTTSTAGVMTNADKTKLDGIAAGAQVNVPTNLGFTLTQTSATITSSTGSNAVLPTATASLAGVMTSADRIKLDGVAPGAQVNVATNLGYTAAATTGTVTSSTGNNTTLPAATTSAAGLMTNADKAKLDGVAAGAQVNVATNLGVTAGTTAGPVITSSTGSNATLPTATASASGVITTGTQTFAGQKNFNVTIGGSINGNAATATVLQTPRTINGVAFNGSANIVINAVDATPRIPMSEKGAASGVATLDAAGKIPLTQLNDTVLGQVQFINLWNAATNNPTLPTSPTKKGDYYIVSVGGTRFGLTFEVGDWIIANGNTWGKVDNTDAVSSVAGRTGNITLTTSDIGGLGNVAVINRNGSTDNFLRGDGTWVTPPNTTYTEITEAEITGGTSSTLRTITGRRMKFALDMKAALNHNHAAATTSVDGFMSSADKSKLNGIQAGAQVNSVTSVAGRTGAVTLTAADVGLGNVNNTADMLKSVASAAAIIPWNIPLNGKSQGLLWTGLTDHHRMYAERYAGTESTRLVIENTDNDDDYTVFRHALTEGTAPVDTFEVRRTVVRSNVFFEHVGMNRISDARLKVEPKEVDYQSFDVNKLALFEWTWAKVSNVPESLRGQVDQGVLAQQVQEVFPDCVREGDEGILRVDDGKLATKLSIILLKQERERSAKLNDLLERALLRIDELESRVSALEQSQ